MLVVPCLLAFALSLGASPGPGDEPPAPHFAVLGGTVRVFAKEAWLTLPAGAALPDSRIDRFSLEDGSRARLTLDGASVELRGPLEVESDNDRAWTLRVSGVGRVELDVRRTKLQIELAASARLDLDAGVYWAEGVPGGGWRVGCEGGAPLVLRPPVGSGWSTSPRVVGGGSLRILPTHLATPTLAPAIQRREVPPWRSFSWPWPEPRSGR